MGDLIVLDDYRGRRNPLPGLPPGAKPVDAAETARHRERGQNLANVPATRRPCPYCKVAIGDSCVTSDGAKRQPHAARRPT